MWTLKGKDAGKAKATVADGHTVSRRASRTDRRAKKKGHGW